MLGACLNAKQVLCQAHLRDIALPYACATSIINIRVCESKISNVFEQKQAPQQDHAVQ
jgi:hypothetical protein